MSEKLRSNVAVISAIVGITIGVFGAIQSFANLPYRIDQAERELRSMKDERKVDREILIRIEEQVKALREEVKKRTRIYE